MQLIGTVREAGSFEEVRPHAARPPAAWGGRAKQAVLWLAVLLPMLWGVAETVKDIRQSMEPSARSAVPGSDAR